MGVWALQAAEKLGVLAEIGEKHPSGAKARVDSAVLTARLKSCPDACCGSDKGFSAACLAPEGSCSTFKQKGEIAMQNWRRYSHVIFLGCFYVLCVLAMLFGSLWLKHDSSNLLLHISVLTNVLFILGLIFWFGPHWKYFSLSLAILLVVYSPIGAIHYIKEKQIFGVVLCVFWFLLGISRFREDKAKLKSLSKSQRGANQLQE